MNSRALMICLTVLLLFSLAGCFPKSDMGSNSSGATPRANETLQQQVARHDAELQRVLAQVGQVEQVLPGQAEMWSQMQTMRQELNNTMGKVEELQVQISAEGTGELALLKDKVARMESLLRQMASQLAINADVLDGGAAPATYIPSGQSTVAPQSIPTTTQTMTPAVTKATPKDTVQALYDAGTKAFDQRKYKDAVVSFKDLTAAYPNHALAGNAYFWTGECYFQMKDYVRATLAYQDTISKFPGSGKIQAAMLKQGIALFNVGKKEPAKERLNVLISKYGSSPEASRAKDFINKNGLK